MREMLPGLTEIEKKGGCNVIEGLQLILVPSLE